MNECVKPSIEIWDWYKGDITPELIASSIADRIAGYHISYSATELLKDLELLTKSGNVNKKAKRLMACQIHDRYHHKKDGIKVLNPYEEAANERIEELKDERY